MWMNQSALELNGVESTGDVINFKDDEANTLITITDEGTVGSISSQETHQVQPQINFTILAVHFSLMVMLFSALGEQLL